VEAENRTGFEIQPLVQQPEGEETMVPYRKFLTKRLTLRHVSASASNRVVGVHTILLVLIVLFALSGVQGAWAGPPTDQLRDGVAQVVKILRDPELKGLTKVNERRAAVNKVADEIFDFGETAKRSLGQHWAQRTPAEREEFVRLFTELLQRTYLSKVDQYNSEMTFQDDVVNGDQAVVRSTLLLGKGNEMSLDYRMHHPRDRWQVYDISIDGISLVANYRSQFNKIVRTDSYEALVARLRSRQVGFAAPAAGPSGGKTVR
jgi:phospholipid transport system substrate-binding protein